MTADESGSRSGADDERRTGTDGPRGLDRAQDGESGSAGLVRRRRFLVAAGTVLGATAGCTDEDGLGSPGGNQTDGNGTDDGPEFDQYSTRAPAYEEVHPQMAAGGFEIELFSDFMDLNTELDIETDINAFDALVADGSRGFDPGLYVSIGPAIREVTNEDFDDAPRIIYVGEDGRPEPVVTGQFGVETMTWARGDYGEGILFTKPHNHQIGRLNPDGTVETIARDVGGPPSESGGPFPLGPAGLAYGPDGRLFVTDYFDKRLLSVGPGGEWENVFDGKVGIVNPTKALAADEGQFGGDFLVGTFSLDPETDALYSLSLDDGGEAEEIAGGFTGMEVFSRGPGGSYGDGIFITEAGPDEPATGQVHQLGESGELRTFVENVDAVKMAFDTEGVLGGGAFLTDFTNKGGSGRVFRITEG